MQHIVVNWHMSKDMLQTWLMGNFSLYWGVAALFPLSEGEEFHTVFVLWEQFTFLWFLPAVIIAVVISLLVVLGWFTLTVLLLSLCLVYFRPVLSCRLKTNHPPIFESGFSLSLSKVNKHAVEALQLLHSSASSHISTISADTYLTTRPNRFTVPQCTLHKFTKCPQTTRQTS